MDAQFNLALCILIFGLLKGGIYGVRANPEDSALCDRSSTCASRSSWGSEGHCAWGDLFLGFDRSLASGCFLLCPLRVSRIISASIDTSRDSLHSQRTPVLSDSSVAFRSVCHVVCWHVRRRFESPWYNSPLLPLFSSVSPPHSTRWMPHGVSVAAYSTWKAKKCVVSSCDSCCPSGINQICCISFVFGSTDFLPRAVYLNISMNTSLF